MTNRASRAVALALALTLVVSLGFVRPAMGAPNVARTTLALTPAGMRHLDTWLAKLTGHGETALDDPAGLPVITGYLHATGPAAARFDPSWLYATAT